MATARFVEGAGDGLRDSNPGGERGRNRRPGRVLSRRLQSLGRPSLGGGYFRASA
jgi:hypothetical protein